MKIQKQDLTKALEIAILATENRPSLPILNNVLLTSNGDTLTLETTDVELTLIVQMECHQANVNSTVPAKKLLDIIKAEKVEVLSIEETKGSCSIKGAKSTYTLSCLPIDDFPATPQIEEFFKAKFTSEQLQTSINAVFPSLPLS